MIGSEITVIGAASALTFGLILIGMVCCFVRMVRGPSLADRVVALDMLTMLMVAFAGVYVVATNQVAFLDVAIALALIGFLGTVAFARYADRRRRMSPNSSIEKEPDACGNT